MAVRVLTLFLAVMALAGVVGAQDAFGCSCVPRSAQQVILRRRRRSRRQRRLRNASSGGSEF